jgi:TetR/AcrR family transcriptional regulator
MSTRALLNVTPVPLGRLLSVRPAMLSSCLALRTPGWQAVEVTEARRLGATDSKTRTLLLDGAERLLLRDGYAAVTSRRVAAEAGVKPQLVHYYFRTMDDLFLEVYRRRAEEGIERFARALEVHPSLRTVWRFGTDLRSAAFNIEFVAVAKHRETIREEIAQYARRFREVQLEAIAGILEEHGVSPDTIPPIVGLLAMLGVSQVMALEEGLGVTAGHREMMEFVESWIDEIETHGPRLPRVADQ